MTHDTTDITRPCPSQPETIHVSADKVACDGGGGAIGHPRVYLSLFADKPFVECPYCDRRYIRSGDAHNSAH